MKKVYYMSIASFIALLLFGMIGYFFFYEKKESDQISLAEIQEVIPSIQEEQKREIALSIEKQKQLNQIGEVYTKYETDFTTQVTSILKKYKNNFVSGDVENLTGILEIETNSTAVHEKILQKLGVNFLSNDVEKLIAAQQKLSREKNLEIKRLKLFQEKNNTDIQNQSQELLTRSIEAYLKANTELSEVQREQVLKKIQSEIFEKTQIFDDTLFSTSEKQETFLKNSISLALSEYTSITSLQKQQLIEALIQHIQTLGVLLPTSETKDRSSFIFPFLGHVHAAETPLTDEEKEILILKTNIRIDELIEESIKAEIEKRQGVLTPEAYSTRINTYLVELEELIILKESLENDASSLTLADIQRFHLGSYVDDSSAIQDLKALAYIQEKNGHVIVYNLNGSTKLAEENMLLYPGYSVETIDSEVTLVFSDESTLQLEPYSQVTLSSPSDTSIHVQVDRGNIWTRVLKPLLSGDTFVIETGDVSLGVRGTSLALSKTSTGTQVHVVDSYTSDGSPSVSYTTTGSSITTPVQKGKKISVNTAGSGNVSNETKVSLLAASPYIQESLQEDLRYLSLILDDRKRGFYNNPLSQKNDSVDFLGKISGELQVSLPTAGEKAYIIKNTELSGQVVHSGSIYHLIHKDTLISDIKASSSASKTQKISAIVGLDMLSLENELGNKRAIENRFDYNITQDIISAPSFSSGQLSDIFLDFPIEIKENDTEVLEQAKKALSINSGSSIVSQDMILPTSVVGYSGVAIGWKSSHPYVLSPTGITSNQIQDTSVILTATLTKGTLSTEKEFDLLVVPVQLTAQEKLEAASYILQTHLNNLSPFEEQIDITDSTYVEMEHITGSGLSISWIPDGVITNSEGTINQPSFSEDELRDHPAQARLSHAGIIQSFTFILPQISKKIETPTQILTRISEEYWQNYIAEQIEAGNIEQKNQKYYITNLSLPLDTQQDEVNIQISEYTDTSHLSLSESLNSATIVPDSSVEKTVTLKASFSLAGVTSTPVQSPPLRIAPGTIIENEYYALVASAEYDTPGDINLKSITGAILPKTSSGVVMGACDSTGNCAWSNKSMIASMYGYDVTKISSSFDKLKSWFTYDSQSGIVLDNTGSPDFLSYNLSSLNLGEDWAIEMSVRGEDLGRNGTYTLLGLGNDYRLNFNQYNGSNYYYSVLGTDAQSESISNYNGWINIQISNQNKNFKVNNTKYLINNLKPALDLIHIGARQDINGNYSNQWNGLINYFKIYKKSA